MFLCQIEGIAHVAVVGLTVAAMYRSDAGGWWRQDVKWLNLSNVCFNQSAALIGIQQVYRPRENELLGNALKQITLQNDFLDY